MNTQCTHVARIHATKLTESSASKVPSLHHNCIYLYIVRALYTVNFFNSRMSVECGCRFFSLKRQIWRKRFETNQLSIDIVAFERQHNNINNNNQQKQKIIIDKSDQLQICDLSLLQFNVNVSYEEILQFTHETEMVRQRFSIIQHCSREILCVGRNEKCY